MDNAFAERTAVPMVVVIPDTHALDPDKTARTEIGRYLNANVQTEDRELFEEWYPYTHNARRMFDGISSATNLTPNFIKTTVRG
jgi:hypothetical protein